MDMVIVVFGLPGSGKSYFASRLAKKLNAWYVNSDGLRKELLPERTYSSGEKLSVYQAMLEMMTVGIGENQTMVLDATFYKKNIRNIFIEQVGSQNETLIFIEVQAKEKLIKERLNRSRADSEADFLVYQKIKKEFEPLAASHLVLESGSDNIDAMLTQALDYLKNLHDS
ncbi:MAG: AAA family ATPase [Cyclobacteriaceae bacterium]